MDLKLRFILLIWTSRFAFLLSWNIAFEATSDKIIDFDSLSIKYLKLIPIDLTGRIKPYLDNSRLTVRNVKLPQGKHPHWIIYRLHFG